jgi:RNA polymerase sigma-70 factor (ECF subfamily)
MSGAKSLEEWLPTWYATGAAAWPGIYVDPAAFRRFVVARVRVEDAPTVRPHGGDFYIACACAARSTKAIEAFCARYLGAFRDRLRRIDPSPAFHDDVMQMVRERLMVGKDGVPPRIIQYKGRGPLESWVAVTILRAAVRLQRASKLAKRSEQRRELPDARTIDPELEYLKRRFRRQFEQALSEALAGLASRPRELLRMRYVHGCSIDEMGAHYGVHRATAARWITAVERDLFAETRRRLSEKLKLGENEMQSLSRVLMSQMDVSLSALIHDGQV